MGEPQWRRCKCAKYLYLLRNGKNKTISAKTRSWEKAEQQAQEIRESWDPLKQKLRELDELKQAQEAAGPIFARLCVVIGLDPEKYASASTELDSVEGIEFDHRLRQWIAERPVPEVVETLNAACVPCCPVMSSEAMAEDPHYQARAVHTEWEDLQVGKVKGTGVAPKFSRTPGKIWRGSVAVGHDNDLIYRDLLGLSAGELANLKERGVV